MVHQLLISLCASTRWLVNPVPPTENGQLTGQPRRGTQKYLRAVQQAAFRQPDGRARSRQRADNGTPWFSDRDRHGAEAELVFVHQEGEAAASHAGQLLREQFTVDDRRRCEALE